MNKQTKTKRAYSPADAVQMCIEAGPEGVRCWQFGCWSYTDLQAEIRKAELPPTACVFPRRSLRPGSTRPTVHYAILIPGTPAFAEAMPDLLDWMENGSAGWYDHLFAATSQRVRLAVIAHLSVEAYIAECERGE